VRVRGNLRANHSETLREAALAGLGLILMPTWLIGGDVKQERLRAVLTEWRAEVGRQSAASRQERGIYALYLADRRASAKVHAFIEFMGKRFGSPPYWDRT